MTLKLSCYALADFNQGTNFPSKLLLTDKQAAKLLKRFANNLSANIKLSKTQISKIVQSGWFQRRLLDPLLKTCLPLTNLAISN